MPALRSGARRPVSPPPKPRSAWRHGQRRPSSTASPSMTSPPPICSSGQAQPPIGPMTWMLRSGGSRQPSCERERRATSTHGGMRRSEGGGLGSPAAEPRSGTFHRSTVSRSSCVKHQTRRRVSEHSLWCCCPKRRRRASIGSHQLNSSTTRNSWLPTPTTSHSAPCWMAHRVCFTSLAGGCSQRRSASTPRVRAPVVGASRGPPRGGTPGAHSCTSPQTNWLLPTSWRGRAAQKAAAVGDWAEYALAQSVRIPVAVATDRPADAEVLADRVELAMQRCGYYYAAHFTYPPLACSRARRGDHVGATAALDQLAAAVGIDANRYRVLVSLADGRVTDARDVLDRAWWREGLAPEPVMADLSAAVALIEAGAALAEPGLAASGERAARFLADRGVHVCPDWPTNVDRLLGLAALTADRIEDAADALEPLIGVAGRAVASWESAAASAHLAKVHVAAERPRRGSPAARGRRPNVSLARCRAGRSSRHALGGRGGPADGHQSG